MFSSFAAHGSVSQFNVQTSPEQDGVTCLSRRNECFTSVQPAVEPELWVCDPAQPCVQSWWIQTVCFPSCKFKERFCSFQSLSVFSCQLILTPLIMFQLCHLHQNQLPEVLLCCPLPEVLCPSNSRDSAALSASSRHPMVLIVVLLRAPVSSTKFSTIFPARGAPLSAVLASSQLSLQLPVASC